MTTRKPSARALLDAGLRDETRLPDAGLSLKIRTVDGARARCTVGAATQQVELDEGRPAKVGLTMRVDIAGIIDPGLDGEPRRVRGS